MVRRKSQNEREVPDVGSAVIPETDPAYVIETTLHRVCDMPERMRPREAIERQGVEHVADEVLLAVILRSGTRGTNVLDVARRLLTQYGSLTGIASTPVKELVSEVRGVGPVKAQLLHAALELARRLAEERLPRRCRIRTPSEAAGLLRDKARGLDKEVFWVLLLDSKNYLKAAPLEITRGLLDASLVHPREVFREAIRSAGAAIVLVHNHPSGDPVPSAEDIRITKQLVDAGKIVDIKVLDHVILGRPPEDGAKDFASMRESGAVEF